MARDKSAGNKDRVNIVYKTVGSSEEKELPFKLLILGDFTMKEDPEPFSQRSPIAVSRDTLSQVFKSLSPRVELMVPADLIGGEDPPDIPVALDMASLRDFEPDAVCEKVEPLKKAALLRRRVTAAQKALSSNPRLLEGLKKLLSDPQKRALLLKELQAPSEKQES